MIAFLDKWQTLIGAILGGIIALGAALIVAYRAERRSDIAAAMQIIGTLVSVRTAGHLLDELAEEKGIANPDDRAAWQAEKLVSLRPKLSPLFEASIARVMPLDVTTAAHLHFFLSQYLDLEEKLQRISSDIKELERTGKPARDRNYMMADAKHAARVFGAVVGHADCAEHLLTKFVLSKMALWNRLWCGWFPDEQTTKCRKVLRDP